MASGEEERKGRTGKETGRREERRGEQGKEEDEHKEGERKDETGRRKRDTAHPTKKLNANRARG